MIIHDIIKIKYVEYGYLPNYPYHLISDEEMIDAFINNDINYFTDNYECPEGMEVEYQTLFEELQYHLNCYLDSDKTTPIPNWVYSYMIGSCITETSAQEDKHDMLVLLNLDNTYDTLTPEVARSIYNVSSSWLNRLPSEEREHRPPTMFGEPHVIKSLRLTYQ